MLTKILIPGLIPHYYNSVNWVGTWKSVLTKNSLGDTDDWPVLGITD